ncbi:fimbria/pilus periplasmic chaperone [Bdellovibrio sp. BCCA]|uniref:fimbria/pilus periplasmic chaperone n=1 Tax=Bdellovibrio sp. BCCA TaxID=3136281 RepID=UPI0030EFE4DE
MIKNLLRGLVPLAFILPSVSFAFRLSPMVIRFSPTGSGATQVLTLENPGGEKTPIQIEAFTRTENEKGEEVRKKTDDFTIYPEQVVLLPNEKRNVRVTWSGDINATEKSYRIIASQLPVEFRDRNFKPKKAGVNLNFLLQYVASAYVTPEGAVAKIKVKDVKHIDAKKISVTVVNEGTAHKVLKVKKLKLFAGDKLVSEIENPKEFDSINLLPGSQKNITVVSSKEVTGSPSRGELELAEIGD